MRISDWSSDVCSSDLNDRIEAAAPLRWRQSEAVAARAIARTGYDRQVRATRALARFDKERIGSRCDFPGHGIAQRHMLDHFILGEDDLRGDAEHARNLIDLPILVVRFPNPVIEHRQIGRASCRESEADYVSI